MPGPPPKGQRRRRNADVYADVQVRVPNSTKKLYGPTLVAAVGDMLDEYDLVRPAVERWWNTWRRAPQAEAFLDTDWQRLTMLAPLVASYFERPHHMKLAEIRQSESLLGATHVDRLRARIKVEPAAEPVASPGVAVLSEYRRDLTG